MSRFKVEENKEKKDYHNLWIDGILFILERSELRQLIQMSDNDIGVGVPSGAVQEIDQNTYKRMIEEARQAAEAEGDDCDMCGS